MIKVLINGIDGHMGQMLLNQINSNENFTCIGGADKDKSINDVKEKADVIIDFSVPVATMSMLEYAKEKKIPVVIATTGFSEEQNKMILDCSKELPIFKSANMSFETNLMIKLVSKLAKELSNSDIEIVDVHHNRKVDSPSGTALMIADNINKALDNSMHYEFDRHSKHAPRDKKEIGIHSLRGGTEVGKHSVFFFGENENMEISHTVNSRAVFANGALKAAEFLIKQNPGFYDMNDLV